MYQELKKRVLYANKKLVEYNLITLTWGNVSEYDRSLGVIAIKPSGISYDVMDVDDIVIVDIEGNLIEGKLKPSSDLPTHLVLYRSDVSVGSVVHTHSPNATAFAQAGLDLIAYGTTHADTFYGSVPCTRAMLDHEILGDYERETGNVIVETFKSRGISLKEVPGCLVFSHGPFAWGSDCKSAVENALVLEEVAKMNYQTMLLSGFKLSPMQSTLLDKHFLRKHGDNAYYGQK